MREPQSLRAQLLSRLTLPLIVVVLLDMGVSYFVALHFANRAYDRWLLDSARSLAQEVKAQKDRVIFDLPSSALEVFRWDDVDKTFFRVESERLGFMAGDRALPGPGGAGPVAEQPLFYGSEIQGRKVRAVAVLTAPTETSEEVLVIVAETLNKRHGMMSDILLAVVVPQLLLLAVTGLHIWTGIDRCLRPLRALTRIIGQRSPKDLAPIPDTQVPLEVRSLTDTINHLLQRLAAAMAAQQRFVENAAHQLRTPLAGLKLQAERALRTRELEAMKPALRQMKLCADRAARLSTQLLVLARSESIMETLQPLRPVDLSGLAKECCMDWVPRALERHMELEFDGPDPAVEVMGDATLLRELLNNLLDNAVQYGRADGRIAVRLLAGPKPTLIVEDNGPGIPETERDRVFERFYRIAGSPGQGCGLGLAIVREITELHGANVVLSQPGDEGGLRVEVVFAASAKELPKRAGSAVWKPANA